MIPLTIGTKECKTYKYSGLKLFPAVSCYLQWQNEFQPYILGDIQNTAL